MKLKCPNCNEEIKIEDDFKPFITEARCDCGYVRGGFTRKDSLEWAVMLDYLKNVNKIKE